MRGVSVFGSRPIACDHRKICLVRIENKAMDTPSFEREFLIRLAPVWLACRWRIMGNQLIGKFPAQDLAFDLLGQFDYGREMKLLCAEVLKKR